MHDLVREILTSRVYEIARETPLDTAHQLAGERGLVFIHPFDDPLVIAGQGTVAVEMLRQAAGELDAIFVPVGGGGLIAGIASYVNALKPNTAIIGVEPVDADAMAQS